MAKSIAKLYFTRSSTDVAMDLASRIRSEGNYCHLIYAGLFSSEKDVQDDAHAVAIQLSDSKARTIARLYRELRPEVEIHFFNDEGDFVDAPADIFKDETVDPFASFKAKPEAAATPEASEPADAEISDDAGDGAPEPAEPADADDEEDTEQ